MLPGKHIHPGTSLDKIKNHLGRHFRSRKANPLLHDPVIGRKNDILGVSATPGKAFAVSTRSGVLFFRVIPKIPLGLVKLLILSIKASDKALSVSFITKLLIQLKIEN